MRTAIDGTGLWPQSERMTIDISKIFERCPEGFQSLCWILYLAASGIGLATLGEISGTLLLIGCIIVIVLAQSRKGDAQGTIYASHLTRIARVMTISLIVALALLTVTILTLGIGILITWPLYLIFLVWLAFALVRGMMKLNDGQSV
jgi:uncharacterized membrane protein